MSNTHACRRLSSSLEWEGQTSFDVASFFNRIPIHQDEPTSETWMLKAKFYDLVEHASTNRVADVNPALSSTKTENPCVGVIRAVEALFARKNEEVFEDGMETEFSRVLVAVILRHGDAAMTEIAGTLRSNSCSSELAGEALRWIGRIKQPSTHAYRKWLLLKCLTHKSPIVRDGAIVGLAALDDRTTRSDVKAALEKESSALLREDLTQLLDQLERPEKQYALLAEKGP